MDAPEATPPVSILLVYDSRTVLIPRPPTLLSVIDKARAIFPSLSRSDEVYLQTRVGPDSILCELETDSWNSADVKDSYRQFTVKTRPQHVGEGQPGNAAQAPVVGVQAPVERGQDLGLIPDDEDPPPYPNDVVHRTIEVFLQAERRLLLIKVKSTTKLGKVYKVMAERLGVDERMIHLKFDGRHVGATDTFDSLATNAGFNVDFTMPLTLIRRYC